MVCPIEFQEQLLHLEKNLINYFGVLRYARRYKPLHMQGDSTALRYIAVYMYIWGNKDFIITMYLFINEDF